MIVGAGKKLKIIREVLNNSVNKIYICENIGNKYDNEYYTLIRIHDDNVIKDVLKIVYDKDGNVKLPEDMFKGLFVDVDTLNILMTYKEPRKIFLYLKSYMTSEYSQYIIIKNMLYQCLALRVEYPLLYLFLDAENINLDEDFNIFFNGFLNFEKLNSDIDEKKCVQKCCEIIDEILNSNLELTNKSHVKAINLFIKKKRNNVYKRIIDIYNDFKIQEKKYKQTQSSMLETIKLNIQNIFKNNFKLIVAYIGPVFIILAAIMFFCNLFKMDLPFTKYKGLNMIGTVNMSRH